VKKLCQTFQKKLKSSLKISVYIEYNEFFQEHRKNISIFAKGKTWEERYGEEIANKMRETKKNKKLTSII